MCPEEKEFIKAIKANPADDTVRLVFADWLEEHGRKVRADFIRTQIEVGNPANEVRCSKCKMNWSDKWIEVQCMRPESFAACQCGTNVGPVSEIRRVSVLRSQIRRRAEEVLNNHRGEVAPKLWWGVLEFDRGFVCGIRCDVNSWMTRGKAVVQSQPIQRVLLSDRKALYIGLDVWGFWRQEKDSYDKGDYGNGLLPPKLYKMLAQTEFPNPTAAAEELSRACLRVHGGLPVADKPQAEERK